MAILIGVAENDEDVFSAMQLYYAEEDRLRNTSAESRSVEEVAWELDLWRGIYASTPEGFVVARDDDTGIIVGVAAAVRRPPQWILTNFFVDPGYQGFGIGRKMFQHAWSVQEGCNRFCVHASFHPSAQSVYMKAGMYPQSNASLLRGHPGRPVPKPSLKVEPVSLPDVIGHINRLDRASHGFEREVDHRHWAGHGGYYLVWGTSKSEPLGYFHIEQQGKENTIVGPLVTANIEHMEDILDCALSASLETSSRQQIFIPGANTIALKKVLDYGYRFQDVELFLSSTPMPGLAQAIMFNTDLL